MNHSRSTSLEPRPTENGLDEIAKDPYLRDMILVVADAYGASSYVPPTGEKLATAKIWARLLRPIIPGDRLMDTFDECFAEHDNSRPLNAYDLKNKWQAMEKRELAEANDREIAMREENAPLHCPAKNLHRDENDAVQEYGVMDKWKVSKYYWMPCHVCRAEAHLRKQGELRAGNPELAGPNPILEDVAKVAALAAIENANLPQSAQESLAKILNMSDHVFIVREEEGEIDAA